MSDIQNQEVDYKKGDILYCKKEYFPYFSFGNYYVITSADKKYTIVNSLNLDGMQYFANASNLQEYFFKIKVKL